MILTRGQCFIFDGILVCNFHRVVDNIAGIFAFPSHRALLCCNNNQGTLLLCKHCIHYNRIGMLYIGTLQWVVIGELVAKAVCTGPVGLGNSKSSLDSALRKDLRHSIRSKHVHTAVGTLAGQYAFFLQTIGGVLLLQQKGPNSRLFSSI